jgi:hypothetical protein
LRVKPTLHIKNLFQNYLAQDALHVMACWYFS